VKTVKVTRQGGKGERAELKRINFFIPSAIRREAFRPSSTTVGEPISKKGGQKKGVQIPSIQLKGGGGGGRMTCAHQRKKLGKIRELVGGKEGKWPSKLEWDKLPET